MQRWEYKTVKLDTQGFLGGIVDAAALDAALNALGREGWELVTSFVTAQDLGASREAVAIFKRPK